MYLGGKHLGYKNGKEILPDELIKQIQKYVDGQNVYIPCKGNKRRYWGENTSTKQVLELRNIEIFNKYQIGYRVIELAKEYHLSEQAIYKVLSKYKRR